MLERSLIPVAYARLLLEILEERGAEGGESFRAAGIPASLDAREDGRLTFAQCVGLVSHALRVTGDPGLGYEMGLRLQPAAHGFLGFAAMTGATLEEALGVASKYIRTRLPQFRLVVARDAEMAVVELREAPALPFLREFFFECVLVGFAQSALLICERPPDLEIWFDWPEPSYYARYRARLPRIRFGRSNNQIRFPAAFLDRRLLFSDADAHREALAQVERESLLGEEDDFVARAMAALRLSSHGNASLTRLATRLGVSARTLRRKLASEGVSYRALYEEQRYRDACRLLEASDLDLVEISKRLGFGSPPGFTRAFKRWAKTTPSGYRARSRRARDSY